MGNSPVSRKARSHVDWLNQSVASEMLQRAITWRQVALSCEFRGNARQAREYMRACALNWRRAVLVWR